MSMNSPILTQKDWQILFWSVWPFYIWRKQKLDEGGGGEIKLKEQGVEINVNDVMYVLNLRDISYLSIESLNISWNNHKLKCNCATAI